MYDKEAVSQLSQDTYRTDETKVLCARYNIIKRTNNPESI